MSDVIDWQIRLAHERAIRDALVACGNPAPDKPDPPGGLYSISARVFNGPVFFAAFNAAGHDNGEISQCRCMKGHTP